MQRIGDLPRFILFIALSSVLLSAVFVRAAEEPGYSDEALLEAYHRMENKLERTSFGFPLYLESSDQDSRVHADVYGIFDHPFSSVLRMLENPENWCDIASLHPNVKACTHRELPGIWQLTFYVSSKAYRSPEDAYLFMFHFRKVQQRQGYLHIVLSADNGPFGTKDHTMRFQAIPLPGGRTFVLVSYSYSYGLSLRLAEKIYYATFGSGKAGFTVTGTDRNGNPLYIGGPRGALERNAVRYYFAIQSFIDTLHYPNEDRFIMRCNRWYDLTSPYRKQLYEMEKDDYVKLKKEERKNQTRLQQRSALTLQQIRVILNCNIASARPPHFSWVS